MERVENGVVWGDYRGEIGVQGEEGGERGARRGERREGRREEGGGGKEGAGERADLPPGGPLLALSRPPVSTCRGVTTQTPPGLRYAIVT